MRKNAVFAATLTAFALFLFSTSIRADLCVLKNGDYSLSGTPCATADGNSDDVIDLIFNVGEDLELDIVYEQTAGPYSVELFTYLMFYDTANMDGTSVACNADPNNYFSDNMAPTLGLPQCTTPNGGAAGDAVDSASIKIVSQTYMNFSGNNWPTSNPSFILDQIVFDNGYSTPSADHNAGSEVYTIDFSTTGGSPTDVGLIFTSGNRCGALTGAQQCSDEGVTTQTIMTSRIFIDQPPCFVGPPANSTVGKCTYTGAAGSCTTGSAAQTILSIGLPSVCYDDSTCSTVNTKGDCGTFGVNFQTADGTAVSGHTTSSYTDTTPVIGDSLSYTFTGVGTGGCQDSSTLTSGSACGSNTTITATGGTCQCGDPPTVTLSDPSEAELGDTCSSCKTFLQGTDIDIEYTATDEDNDDTDLSDLTAKFFYTDDLSVAPVVVDATVSSNGKVTATIDKAYVSAEADIYFAVIVTDEDLLTDAYPDGFTCSATAPTADCMTTAANVNKINKDNIKVGTMCAFIDGETPYPNMFPFRASGYSTGSEGNLLKIFYSLNEVAHVTMRIYTMDGMLVRQIENDSTVQVQTPGQGETCSGEACNFCNWQSGCQWDGTTYRGGNDLVANGMYIVNIHAICTGDNFYGQSVDYTKGIVVMK